MLTQSWRRAVVVMGLLTVFVGCGDDDGPIDGEDAGGADAGTDASTSMADGGRDAGSDAGPSCTSGCDVEELALGSKFSCARRENGEVLCWGRGQEGQLGDGSEAHGGRCVGGRGIAETFDCTPRPVIVDIDGATAITAGFHSACALDGAGVVSCWGLPAFRVNNAPEAVRYRPAAFPTLTDQAAVSDSTALICSVQSTGGVVCAGRNGSRQTGAGSRDEFLPLPRPVVLVPEPETAPAPLEGALELVTSTFGDSACARTADALYCWGTGYAGQLGRAPSSLDACPTASLSENRCTEFALEVPGLEELELRQIALGGAHTCALTSEGEVYCWGDNRAGQLGTDDGNQRFEPAAVSGLTGVVAITAGSNHSCAVLSDGSVRCWGYNRFGQLGDGDDDHGSVCTLGELETGDCVSTPTPVSGIDDATAIASGTNHVCVVRAEGTQVWCWGQNDMLQVQGSATFSPTATDLEPRPVPVRVTGL